MSKPWIGYIRLSPEEQEGSSILDTQIELVKRSGAQSVFCDLEAGSGRKREQLEKVLELVANHEVEGLITTRWDRLARTTEDYLRIKEIFSNSGTQLRLLDQEDVALAGCNTVPAGLLELFPKDA